MNTTEDDMKHQGDFTDENINSKPKNQGAIQYTPNEELEKLGASDELPDEVELGVQSIISPPSSDISSDELENKLKNLNLPDEISLEKMQVSAFCISN